MSWQRILNFHKEARAGFILAILLGFSVYWLTQFEKALSPLVTGIILGMVVRTFMGDKPSILPGIDLAPKFFIPLGIILYGINLKFYRLTEISGVSWIMLITQIIVIFLIAIYLGRKLNLKDETSLLIATGTAICGASAIAIVTPLVRAKSEDAGASLIAITAFGLIGLLIYPLTITYAGLLSTDYAILCATTLHMTGLVKIAASYLGQSCLNLALSIKLARTTMIIPIIGFIILFFRKKRETEIKSVFFSIPWFMWAFILMGFLTSFVPQFETFGEILKPWATIFFTIALTSIGLTVDLKKLLNVGGVPLIIGLICWMAGIAIFIIFKTCAALAL